MLFIIVAVAETDEESLICDKQFEDGVATTGSGSMDNEIL